MKPAPDPIGEIVNLARAEVGGLDPRDAMTEILRRSPNMTADELAALVFLARRFTLGFDLEPRELAPTTPKLPPGVVDLAVERRRRLAGRRR